MVGSNLLVIGIALVCSALTTAAQSEPIEAYPEKSSGRRPRVSFCVFPPFPFSWQRKKYGWAVFCGPSAPPEQAVCAGQCLRVTNNATGAQETARIEYHPCSQDGLNLEVQVFNKLDTNGQGYQQGYLLVNYEFVKC